MSKSSQDPPKWMNRILEFYCKPHLLEDLQGDLHEYYAQNLSKGRFKANLIFLLDVMKFFRPYTVKQPKIFVRMTFFNLFGTYFKTSLRNLKRHKLFSTINVVSLAISMSVGILMITYLSGLLGYDHFHDKKDRIYRILTHYQSVTSDSPTDLASTSVYIGQKLQEEYQGIEELVILRRGLDEDLTIGDKTISAYGFYASESFFEIFSFRLKDGASATALENPYSLVLTENTAEKLFQDKNPVGEILVLDDKNYTVTGVMENIPEASHMQFEFLASFSTAVQEERAKESTYFFEWNNVWMNHVYVLLPEGQSSDALQNQLDRIAATENAGRERYTITMELENILAINPGRDLSNQISSVVSWDVIYQLLALTIIVLLSACFNYTNLSIARSLRRSKEVGVRKVVGASRNQVFLQFIFEAVIIALIALFVAFGLFLIIKPEFINLIMEGPSTLMQFQWLHLIYFLAFAIFIGVIAGFLPSLFLSKLKAISIFKDASQVKFLKGMSLRRALIICQFSLSMAFIMGATIAYRQFNYALNFDLGFTTENILNVDLKGNDSELLINELRKIPEVTKISRSALIPSAGSVYSEEVKYKDPLDSAVVYINHVDSAYLGVHNFKLLAGTTFPYDLKKDEDTKFVIIDERLRERFAFESPQSAIGESLRINRRSGDFKVEIVGVIDSYQYTTIQSIPEPTLLFQGKQKSTYYLNLAIRTENIGELMDKLEAAWSKVDPIHPFEATFFDESIASAYGEYKVMFRIFTFLAFLAVSIASMGLLGMAVFTTETRMKEISVRKVMGASESNLVYLLSRSFMFMLLTAALIAVPATYALFEQVILDDYVNRISIGFLEIVPGTLGIILLGLLTISWQTRKAARTNPAEMLRND
ncbi:MAG: ABC transporter permease [Cyclobacteriaceae bacterium]